MSHLNAVVLGWLRKIADNVFLTRTRPIQLWKSKQICSAQSVEKRKKSHIIF